MEKQGEKKAEGELMPAGKNVGEEKKGRAESRSRAKRDPA